MRRSLLRRAAAVDLPALLDMPRNIQRSGLRLGWLALCSVLLLAGRGASQEVQESPYMKPLLGGHLYWQVNRGFNTPDDNTNPANLVSSRTVQFTLEVAFEEHPDCTYNTGESVKCPTLKNGVADAHGVSISHTCKPGCLGGCEGLGERGRRREEEGERKRGKGEVGRGFECESGRGRNELDKGGTRKGEEMDKRGTGEGERGEIIPSSRNGQGQA